MNIKNFCILVDMLRLLSEGWSIDKYFYDNGLSAVLSNGNNEIKEFYFTTMP